MEPLAIWDPAPLISELAAAEQSSRGHTLATVGTPLRRGPLTTFVHDGRADTVRVEHFMSLFPTVPQMRTAGTDLHEITVRLPEGVRFEYKLAISVDGQTSNENDLFNPHLATSPYGLHSVAFGHGYVEPDWIGTPAVRIGTVRRGYVESQAFGKRRNVRWYVPDSSDGPLPLLVVTDGTDFIDHAGFVDALDNLIGANIIPPMVAAFIDPGERLIEYTDDPTHATFVREVVDAATRRQGADPDPARHVYLGTSMGAVAALSAAWRFEPIGGLILMSGSFVTALGGPMNRSEHFSPVIDFMERFAAQPGSPAKRIYQSCGVFEGLAPDNRDFTPILERTGADVLFEEVPDGHHWHNWRDRLGVALPHAFASRGGSRSITVQP